MKTTLLILFAYSVAATAATDRVAIPTYFHTKLALPAPHLTGEIIAESDYDSEHDLVRIRTLTVKLGSRTVEVPKRILDLFLGPRLTSLELHSGPPKSPDSTEPGYFNVTFKYESYSNESLYQPPLRPTASIIIRDGVITDLSRVQERATGGNDSIHYDPATLKPIIRDTE
jgi:hypothetical protein